MWGDFRAGDSMDPPVPQEAALRMAPPRFPPAPPGTSEGGSPPLPPGSPELVLSALGACLLDVTVIHTALLLVTGEQKLGEEMRLLALQSRMSLQRRLTDLHSECC